MVDTSIIMQAARTPSVNLPDILQRSAESAAAIERAPIITEQLRTQAAQQQADIDFTNQQRQQQDAMRRGGIIYNYAKQLKSLPMAQRRTFLNTIPKDSLTELGIDPAQIHGFAIDDASIDTAIAQLEPIVMQTKAQTSARRSESLAGGRITVQELDDGTVRYLEYGREIPQGQIQERVNAANREYQSEQSSLYASRTGGALGAKLEGEPELERRKTTAKAGAKGSEDRAQAAIDAGLSASYQLPTLRRSIELLNEVETGGFDRAALRVKQAFGVEGGDEGELSANLGKAVLGQLRETFGAAFTEKEGERLERIEASFGRSPETNKRLLKNTIELAERKVEQAIKRAEERGDLETVDELKSNMSYMLSANTKQDKPAQAEQTNEFEGFEIIE